MIVPETLTINEKEFIKTYSDSGYKIERDGIRYSEAIDPVEFGRQYTETDEPIRKNSIAAFADYRKSLKSLEVNET